MAGSIYMKLPALLNKRNSKDSLREREAQAKRKAIAVPFVNNYCDLFQCIAIMQAKEAPISQTCGIPK